MQDKIERTCTECGKTQAFVWKEISRWMRDNRGRALDDYLCNICAIKKRATRHGDSKIPLYTHWKSMFTRTRGKGDPHTLKYYVAKGIQVCPEWYDYETFKQWALRNGFKPNSGLVIDRIDGSKHYSPENCQWMTKAEHASKSWEDRKGTNNAA